MHSEKLNKERELVENVSRERAVGNDRSRPEKTTAESSSREENDERPAKLVRARGLDLEAKDEDEVADTAEADKPTKLADRRNLKRVDEADEVDGSLLRKHCLPVFAKGNAWTRRQFCSARLADESSRRSGKVESGDAPGPSHSL
jgi:hypothetical protein